MSKTRIVSGVLIVLGIAVVGFVLRGVVHNPKAKVASVHTKGLPGAVPGTTGTDPAAPSAFVAHSAVGVGVPKGASRIATARTRFVRVYKDPKAKHSKALRQRVFNGQRIPLTFLIRSQRKGWVEVNLPTRPNQSHGWVPRHQVDITFTQYAIAVRPKTHTLELYNRQRPVFKTKIAVGASLSPTPAGTYFVTDLIRAKDPKGFFGPFALGLSAHSNVYSSFEGGDGQVGIHGTSQPAALGMNVSHGCIRVSNAIISQLAKKIPLGTPVTIVR